MFPGYERFVEVGFASLVAQSFGLATTEVMGMNSDCPSYIDIVHRILDLAGEFNMSPLALYKIMRYQHEHRCSIRAALFYHGYPLGVRMHELSDQIRKIMYPDDQESDG